MNIDINPSLNSKKITLSESFESLADDILDRLYSNPEPVQVLGLEEFLKLPVNDLYRDNKLAQELKLNSNIIINTDVKSESEKKE